MTKRVLIVDDHPIVRHGLKQLLEQTPGIVVCGEAEDAAEVLPEIAASQPDIVLLDISLKTVSGIDVLADVRAAYPDLPVLILTMHDESRYAERALRAGAQGYVIKEDPPEGLVRAIDHVLRGEMYLSEGMTSKMLKNFADGGERRDDACVERLSAREREVFVLIGQGMGTRQIAAQLQVSVKTVDAHRANIKRKLELKSGTQLMQVAIKWTLAREGV